jgi:hypothetical protein
MKKINRLMLIKQLAVFLFACLFFASCAAPSIEDIPVIELGETSYPLSRENFDSNKMKKF